MKEKHIITFILIGMLSIGLVACDSNNEIETKEALSMEEPRVDDESAGLEPVMEEVETKDDEEPDNPSNDNIEQNGESESIEISVTDEEMDKSRSGAEENSQEVERIDINGIINPANFQSVQGFSVEEKIELAGRLLLINTIRD